MKLVDRIRAGRPQPQGKKPLPATGLAVVAAIVKTHGLTSVPQADELRVVPTDKRPLARLSLFPLLTAAQLHLSREIVARFDNPYLVYARSPEDFKISQLLFERRPDLPTEVFQEHSLASLLNQEMGLKLRQ